MNAHGGSDIPRENSDNRELQDAVVASTAADLLPGAALVPGRGTGRFTCLLARMGWHVTGIDASRDVIDRARKQAREEHLDARFIVADAETWSPDHAYDLVVSAWSLPGGAASHKVMATATRALKPGGTLIAIEWDHSMEDAWGLEPDDLASPSDLAAMVPDLTIESAESRNIATIPGVGSTNAAAGTSIAYLRARKPGEHPPQEEDNR